MKAIAEKTDTFGGEANYSWCDRHEFEIGEKASDLAIIRRAKALCGYSGMRGKTYKYGDMIEFRPHGLCQVMFVTFEG